MRSTRDGVLRFDRNERTTLFSEEEFKTIISCLTPYDLIAYGELEPLYKEISQWLNIDRECLLITSGSDTGIKAIFETYVGPGDEILNLSPNYAMFSVYAKMFGAKEIVQYYDEDFIFDTTEFIKKINHETKLVVVTNPGHTGSIISREEIIRITATAASFESLVLIDEAYHHFYPQTVINSINHYNNIIISRTFSKAFGIASLRIGFLVANKELIQNLYKVKLAHEVTGVAAKITTHLLHHLDIMKTYVKDVNAGKKTLYERLPKLGIEFHKSEANFVFFKLPTCVDISLFLSILEENKVFIKGPYNEIPFKKHFRITVGSEVQMNSFCDLVEEIFHVVNNS